MRVDGVCTSTSTIYEFYGDTFHGNPQLYTSDQYCCGLVDMTAGQLYDRTTRKEQQIIQRGYTLVTMWENDWKQYEKQIKKNSNIH